MDSDDRLLAGVAALAHLQSAALEVIAALRATLDVAEDLVKDPSFTAAGGSVAGVVTRVFEAVEPLISPRRPADGHPADGYTADGHPADGRPGHRPNDHDGDGPVEHIRVS